MKEGFEKILGQDLKHCIVVHNLMVGSWYLCSSKSVQASDDGARSGVKMSNHSWVFSCRNESRVIQEKRIINQEDLEARV